MKEAIDNYDKYMKEDKGNLKEEKPLRVIIA